MLASLNTFNHEIEQSDIDDISENMSRSRSPSFKRPPPSPELLNKKSILPSSPIVSRYIFANILSNKKPQDNS